MTRGAVVGLALSAAGVVALYGCTSPSKVTPPQSSAIALEGHRVSWTSSEPTLAAVRFGDAPGAYRKVAYPPADGRGDKTATTAHSVPLLSVATGDTVYAQLVDTTPSGATTLSNELVFVIGSYTPPPLLTWTMIDVGFGDSHLLTMPTSGERVLIDGGERRDWPNVDAYLQSLGISHLEVVVATHIHIDHLGGLIGEPGVADDGVLGAYDVSLLIDGPNHSAERFAYDELLGLLAERGIPRAVVESGDTRLTHPALDWDGDVDVTVLSAGYGSTIGGDLENDWINNDSIVLRISYGDVDMILGGDAQSQVENLLVTGGTALDSELFKVHHHGVDGSNSGTFLTAVNPRVGLIPIVTYESNSGTLPDPAVLGRLQLRRIDVYASDRAEPLDMLLDGDAGIHVTVVTDGNSYEVQAEPSQSRHYPGSTVRTEDNECVH